MGLFGLFKKREDKNRSRRKQLGEVIHYFRKPSVGVFRLKGPIEKGDRIEIKGHTTDFTQKVGSMQINGETVLKARKGQEVGVKVKKRVHKNDKVYKFYA